METFKFICFGSGSSGNSYLVETSEGRFLLDSGIGIRRLLKDMTSYGINPSTIRAIFLTHDHCDHVRSASQLSTKFNIPIFATELTWAGIAGNPTITMRAAQENRHTFVCGETITCCGCTISSFTIPHDSKDNVGYYLQYHGKNLCLITDAGHVTEEMLQYIGKARNLILESNYDEEMLRLGPYPLYLKARIIGEKGHLSNQSAAEIVANNIEHLAHIWLCHLSQNNNTPQSAYDCICEKLQGRGANPDSSDKVTVLKRTQPSIFFDLQ